jgi:hypothetical protein
MISQGRTTHQRKRETQDVDLTKLEEEVRTEGGKRIRSSGNRSNTVSSTGKRKVI